MTKFAAHAGQIIWGSGATPEAAMQDVADWIGSDMTDDDAQFLENLQTHEMTPELADEVSFENGAFVSPFAVMPDGRLGLLDV